MSSRSEYTEIKKVYMEAIKNAFEGLDYAQISSVDSQKELDLFETLAYSLGEKLSMVEAGKIASGTIRTQQQLMKFVSDKVRTTHDRISGQGVRGALFQFVDAFTGVRRQLPESYTSLEKTKSPEEIWETYLHIGTYLGHADSGISKDPFSMTDVLTGYSQRLFTDATD